jgi:ribosomal-protein-alanine N-acetyltransferase
MKTEKLRLRDINREDSQTLYELIFSDKDVIKYTFGKDHISEQNIYEYVKPPFPHTPSPKKYIFS